MRITGFHGCPGAWGAIIRTIKVSSGRFTYMSAFSHRIAASCDDGTVGIHDSVTGVLRLSLSPANPAQAIRGSPDGSLLFCTHQRPSVTIWDIQTGGLICTFVLEWKVEDIAISLGGHYFACGLSNGTVKIWEIANKVEFATLQSGSPVAHLCWLEPEERLVVANGTSVRIWDVSSRKVLHSLTMLDPVCGVVYAPKFKNLAIATTSGSESTITVVDPQTGISSVPYGVRRSLSCFAFSQTTKELVCGMKTPGLGLFNFETRCWRYFDYPATITSVSTLSSGTVVANTIGSGIQLLSLDEEYAPSQQLAIPALSVRLFDEERIIAVTSLNLDYIILLEAATMSLLLTINIRKTHTIHPAILCASLNNRVAVYCFEEGGKAYLQMWRFGNKLPKWTVPIDESPSIGGVSPTGTRLATFHNTHCRTDIYVWDVQNGRLQAHLLVHQLRPTPPLEVEFESEDRFYSHHNTYRIPHDLNTQGSTTEILRRRQQPLSKPPSERLYGVDDSGEWVISGADKICWIPPGYIKSDQAGYCWAGSELIMTGQDGTFRKLAFRNPYSEG